MNQWVDRPRRTVDHYIFIERGISRSTASTSSHPCAIVWNTSPTDAFSPPKLCPSKTTENLPTRLKRGYCQWYQTNSFRQGGRGALTGKRIIAAAGACSLMFGLTTTAAGASTMHPALSGTLTMNVFTFTTPVMQPVIAAFEKLNPGVHDQGRQRCQYA